VTYFSVIPFFDNLEMAEDKIVFIKECQSTLSMSWQEIFGLELHVKLVIKFHI